MDSSLAVEAQLEAKGLAIWRFVWQLRLWHFPMGSHGMIMGLYGIVWDYIGLYEII